MEKKVNEWSAHWCDRETIIWKVLHSTRDLREYRLYFDPQCNIKIQSRQATNSASSPRNLTITGGSYVKLEPDLTGPSPSILLRFPHLQQKKNNCPELSDPTKAQLHEDFLTLRFPETFANDKSTLRSLVKSQLVLSLWEKDVRDSESLKLLKFSGVQIPGVLDDFFGSYTGSLGPVFSESEEEREDGIPRLRLWAPTALSVAVHIFNKPSHWTWKERRKREEKRQQNIDLITTSPSPSAFQKRVGEGTNNREEEEEEEDNENDELMRVSMTENKETGVWEAKGNTSWLGKYYLYEVRVFVPRANRISTHFATDPYSHSLSGNGERSQIVNLNDCNLIPNGWSGRKGFALPTHPVDSVIYELHIRDFSMGDATVPPRLRGTYLAFADEWTDEDLGGKKERNGHEGTMVAGETTGMKHLKRLASSGLNYVHLLPSCHFSSVDEVTVTQERVRGEFTNPLLLQSSGISTSTNAECNDLHPPKTGKQCLKSHFSEEPQAIIREMNVRGTNPHNWGYDPVHWLCPEGSYSTDSSGSKRVSEFRRMVMGLHNIGLGVVLDVVFNHCSDLNGSVVDRERKKFKRKKLNAETNCCFEEEEVSEEYFGSVLERVVPGYYHRMDLEGGIERSACGLNTATEHKMMQKLMIDACKFWVRNYHVDGFRFDLMGHHMKTDLTLLKDELNKEKARSRGDLGEGEILIYGEGWNFGEVEHNSRGVNAAQENMAGTMIGTFNDRFRDAVRGGSVFGPKREQGFASGLGFEPNEESRSKKLNKEMEGLLKYEDWIKIGLAGNLLEYSLKGNDGKEVKGKDMKYSNGRPIGYCQSPAENVLYVSAHDNETLFDALQMKMRMTHVLSSPPSSSKDKVITNRTGEYQENRECEKNDLLTGRVRMQCLANSLVLFGQGLSFFHAGDDFLRSKSMDRNSYSSGDWFNAIDWSFLHSPTTSSLSSSKSSGSLDIEGALTMGWGCGGWGRGLPPCEENEEYWDLMRKLLADPHLCPSSKDMLFCHEVFCEHLRIRQQCRMLRLRTATEIMERLKFRNCGENQIPGVIVMEISGTKGREQEQEQEQEQDKEQMEEDWQRVLVFWNVDKKPASLKFDDLKGKELKLHPVQEKSIDSVVKRANFQSQEGSFSIPPRTTAVFVEPKQ